MSLQGIPWQDKDFICEMDSPFLSDLAGNAFSATVALAWQFSLMAHTPFCSPAAFNPASFWEVLSASQVLSAMTAITVKDSPEDEEIED